jgi:hypothetical protein
MNQRNREQQIDDTSAQSFPASDPPSSTSTHAGAPQREGKRWVANAIGDLRRDEQHAYAVITSCGGVDKEQRRGLSHVEAMMLAERLRRDGEVAIVMHVVGDRSYEVDRYPAR